ncbi:MAG TPA: enoyl-CoA hydratase/isomerase family protein [Syntrophomonas sp.]|nr:enoyl-CoA hydratase/isomerase family protein [Syntrophomonas sp.]
MGINSPETKNALANDLMVELGKVWDLCENDDEIRVIILYSALNDIFCSGMDIKDSIPVLNGQRPPVTENEKYLYDESNDFAGFAKVMLKIRTLYKPIIAAINGMCLTGGFEMAQACDLRIGTVDSKYMAKETQLGIQPMSGGNINLPYIIGHGRAMEMNLTGDAYPANTMLEWGFLNKVCPDKETMMQEAMKLAERLAANGPMSQRGICRLNKESRGLPLEQAYAKEIEIALPVFRGGDPVEGIQAMFERRKPVYPDKR